MRRHTTHTLFLATLAMGLSTVSGPPADAGESLETRRYDVRDIVRRLPNAELPGGPGDRALVFNGYGIEHVLGSPGFLWYVGSERDDEEAAFSFTEGDEYEEDSGAGCGARRQAVG